jgi:hypothetical protein
MQNGPEMRVACVASIALAIAGCGGKESPLRSETSALLADGDDVLSLEGDTEQVGSALAGGDATSAPEPNPALFPVLCYTRERKLLDAFTGTDIYHLRGCGPWRVRGDVALRWQLRPLVAHAELEAHELTIGTTVIKNALVTADVSASNRDRTMIWQAHFDGWLHTDKEPRAFSRDTQKTLRWTVGGGCITADGTSAGTLDSPKGTRSVRVTMIGLRFCGAPCPEPNSRIRLDNLVTREHIEIDFKAQGHAVLTDTEGNLLPIKPRCAM